MKKGFKIIFLIVLASQFICAGNADAFLFFRKHKSKSEILLNNMNSYFNDGDCNKTLEIYNNFSNSKPNSKLREKAYYLVGQCYEKSGSFDKAIDTYKLSINLYPENMSFAYRLAIIYTETGFYNNAIPLLVTILKSDKKDISANVLMARAHAGLGFLSDAVSYYEKTVKLQNYSDADTLNEYAFCLINYGKLDEAKNIVLIGDALNGSYHWPHIMAKIFAAYGAYDGAIDAISEAINRQNLRELRMEKALYYYLNGNFEDAKNLSDKELRRNPYDRLAQLIKALSLQSQNKKAEAEHYFKMAMCGSEFIENVARAAINYKIPITEGICR